MRDYPADMKMSNAMLFLNGKGPIEQFTISNGTHNAYMGYVRRSDVTDSEGHIIPKLSKLSEVFNGEFKGILDEDNITMLQSHLL